MATILSACGAVPFVMLVIAIAVLDAPTNATAGLWLQTYAAVILSFLGGIRWGLALSQPSGQPALLALCVLPALAGWAILPFAIILLPGAAWYLAYAGLFALHLAWDISSASVPSGFKPVRTGVSLVVIASLVAAWAVRTFLA